jgi:hypothetical protein
MRALLLLSAALLPLTATIEIGMAEEPAAIAGSGRAWGEEQATGKPNTPTAGDHGTAWASATPDDEDEWLELEYAEAIEPEYVFVYETYNPGALARICGFTPSGMEAELWSGVDPTERSAGIGVSEVKVETKLKTKRVRIYLNSKEVPGWNEIDAVGLKDAEGKMHWAVGARASSSYAAGRSTGVVPLTGTVDFVPVITTIESVPPPRDPRDERIERLEEEVRELRKLVEELVERQKSASSKP